GREVVVVVTSLVAETLAVDREKLLRVKGPVHEREDAGDLDVDAFFRGVPIAEGALTRDLRGRDRIKDPPLARGDHAVLVDVVVVVRLPAARAHHLALLPTETELHVEPVVLVRGSGEEDRLAIG